MAKKHLGQNFLKSGKALNDVISASDLTLKDTVLEIGPGKGALTRKILEHAGKVIAIEKDADLIPLPQEEFKDEIKNKKLVLLEADVLTFDFSKIKKGYKVVANIPFYITGAIIERFLESENQPSLMTLIVQKEVAERIVARDEKESILSMSVKVFGEPKYVAKIPARYFSPEPKVDSAIICIKNIKNPLKTKDLAKFFKFVKGGFAQKRKTLSRNLANIGLNKEEVENFLLENGLIKDIRAEKVDKEIWIKMVKEL